MYCFIFFDSERVVVIKQSIMVLPVEKQHELSLNVCKVNKVFISKRNNENTVCFFTVIVWVPGGSY